MADKLTYVRVNWEDSPSENTPINSENLNKMDAAIEAVVKLANQHSGQIADLEENGTGVDIPEEQVDTAVKEWLDEHPEATTTVQDGSITEEKLHPELVGSLGEGQLYAKTLLSNNGSGYDKFPIELENYSWNHFAGTKRIAPLAEKATLFTTEGATAHEANAVGFNGNWFLFQWVQNIKGTTVDMEDASGSCEIQGKLMYFRYGIAYSLTGQSDAFTISKQGDTIKRTVAGDTITASGGVGICNVANKDSTTIYSISTYYHNGKHIPTTKEIVIDSKDYTTAYNGKLTIGEATMWTLTKGGVKSDFDDSILGTEYGGHVNCQIYCDYASSGYKYYMAVVRPNKGISIITSTDCTNWTWVADVDIPVENTAYIETALAYFGNRWYVAVRCKDGRLWVAKLMTNYTVNWNFFIPDCGSKPQFVSVLKSLILVSAPQSRYSCRLYRLTSNTVELSNGIYPDRIEAIGDITYNACNYPFFCGAGGYPSYNSGTGVATFLCLGTNNFVTNKLGCSYFIDQPFRYLMYPNEAVNLLNEVEIPSEYVTEDELDEKGYISKVKTINGESLVGEGDITIESGSGGSGDGWQIVEDKVLETDMSVIQYSNLDCYDLRIGIEGRYNDNGDTLSNQNATATILINESGNGYHFDGQIGYVRPSGTSFPTLIEIKSFTIAPTLDVRILPNANSSDYKNTTTAFVNGRKGKWTTEKINSVVITPKDSVLKAGSRVVVMKRN